MTSAPDPVDDEPDSEEEPDSLTDLRDQILQDIKTREQWLRRQAIWYQMRHDGIRRRNKPWPNASDLHFPLADSIIERLKPFYFNQLFATETLASFISSDRSLDSVTTDIGYWFDYKLKQESNIETEALICIDQMLMAGMDVMKVRWNPDGGQKDEDGHTPGCLEFDAIDPSNVIVPQWTKGLQDADRITIVHTISKEQYRRDPRFTDKSEDFITSISGRQTGQDGRNLTEEQLKLIREGTTYSTDEDEITYWESWQNTAGGWLVHFMSPMDSEQPLRPSMKNPLTHGKAPFVRFDVEIKGKGHYSSRGIPERIGAFEVSTCKTWNEKTDYMTLCNRPIFTTDTPIPNAGNLRLIPGQIIAGGLSVVEMPQPPVSFEQEMDMQRQTAEQLIGMPDFGQGDDKGNEQSSKTATEVNHISALMNVSVDLRARTFRKSLGELYAMAWQTLLQYDQGTQFVVGEDFSELDPQVMDALRQNPDGLTIQPNGSGDSWNRQGQLQKAVNRLTMFKGSPFINQGELTKSILVLDDPRLVKTLYQDPNAEAQNQYEDEAKNIPTLLLGFPIPPAPGEDFPTRIKCLVDFLHSAAVKGMPPNPHAIQAIQGRITGMLQALHQQNPKQAQQVNEALKTMSAAHQQAAMQQGGGGVPPGAPPNMQAGQAQPPLSMGQGVKSVTEQIKIDYKSAPPDVQRQMEIAAGFRPSSVGNSQWPPPDEPAPPAGGQP